MTWVGLEPEWDRISRHCHDSMRIRAFRCVVEHEESRCNSPCAARSNLQLAGKCARIFGSSRNRSNPKRYREQPALSSAAKQWRPIVKKGSCIWTDNVIRGEYRQFWCRSRSESGVRPNQ